MKEKIKEVKKVLICGLGSIGKRHLRIINNNWPSVKVSALRSNKLKFDDFQENDNLRIYKNFFNFDDAYNWDPDCVIISNPANLHLHYALNFAKRGKHILIEKPVGSGSEDETKWKELIASSMKVKVLIGYVFRQDCGINKIRNEISKIGQLIEADFYCGSWLPDWRTGNNEDYKKSVSANYELGGGALLELSHEVDLAYWLLGPLKIKYAYLSKSNILEIDVEDNLIIHALNEDNCSVSLRLNFCTNENIRLINIKGAKGSIKYDLISGKLEIKIGKDIEEIIPKNFSKDHKYLSQLNHFFDCIEYDKNPICPLSDGLQVLEYIKIAKSLNSNKLI